MSENMVIFYELVSDVKGQIVNSDDKREIIIGGPHGESEQQYRDSNSGLELKEFNDETNQIESPSIDDEIDIKYEVNDTEYNFTTGVKSDLDTDEIVSKCSSSPRKYESMNVEETVLSQLYLALLQCEGDCVTCQKYIRKLSEHVKGHHFADQRDPLDIDPDMSADIEIKSEVDKEIEGMDYSEESDSESEVESKSDRDPDPEYHVSRGLNRNQKRKSVGNLGKDHKRDKSSVKNQVVSPKKFPNKEKRFNCEECGKDFGSNGILTIHMRVHSQERPYKCGYCEKSFLQKCHLTVHMMIHTGERPFKCEECTKDFKRRTHLALHRKRHTGEKPFSCDQCDKCCKSKSELITHVASHTLERPYLCEECGKGYKRANALRIHKISHVRETPPKREECAKCFTTKIGLATHKRIHNGQLALVQKKSHNNASSNP